MEAFVSVLQRVLNDLKRARLSRRCMLWLLSPPLTPLPSVSSSGDTQEDWERETTCLTEDGEEGGGGGAEIYDGEKAWSTINNCAKFCFKPHQSY